MPTHRGGAPEKKEAAARTSRITMKICSNTQQEAAKLFSTNCRVNVTW